MIAKRIPLGVVVCQRRFHLFDEGGNPHAVTVTLGSPVPTDSEGGLLEAGAERTGTFRCPFQIEGLGHDAKIEAVFGQDPYVALQYAIDFIGTRLDGWSTEQRFSNRHRAPERTSWVWTYPPDQEQERTGVIARADAPYV